MNTEKEPAEIRVAITYQMEREKGEDTAEDVLVVRLTRKRMELFKRAISPDATLDEIREAGLGSAALMVYSLAKMRGWDDGWIVDVREAEGQ